MKIRLWAEIRRLHEIEKLSGRKIAAKLRCSRKTVRRALNEDQAPIHQTVSRSKQLAPFHDRIAAVLAKDPDLSAVRICEKLSKPEGDSPGYEGGITQLRVYLKSIRTVKRRVYQEITYEPGEAMQVDWGDVGPIRVGSATRKISVFVAVLCYSKMIYIEFTLSQKKSEFYRSIVHALEFFGGTPKKIVFDNLKAAVLNGSGRNAVLHPEFEALCGHYYLQPIACEARDPESKGLVENTVRYVKRNALAGRSDELQSWEDYHRLAIHWRDTVANVRIHDRLGERPVDRLKVEKQSLRPLPLIGYSTEEIVLTEVRSTAVVEFDCNRYTVPPQFVRQNVTLLACSNTIRIMHKGVEIAVHARSYDKRVTVSNSQHKLDALLMRGKQRASDVAMNFAALGPEAQAFQLALSKLPVRASVHLKRILQLVDLYGRESVLKALGEALQYNTVDAAYVEVLVVQARRKASLPSPTQVQPKRKDLIQLELELPDPGRYDRFTYEDDNE
jgi:transposase